MISPQEEALFEAEARSAWQQAATFFRQRGAAIFFSQSRYWEDHGFVQQSLAYQLAEGGVPVTWFDGIGWRRYRPKVREKAPGLQVQQLSTLPFRRIPWIESLATRWEWGQWQRRMNRYGGKPLVWIQDGLDPKMAARLPYVDVFSVFDDPYLGESANELGKKAKIILTQNSFAHEIFSRRFPDKTFLAPPPVKLGSGVFAPDADVNLPPGFPERRMGYIGSFYSTSFDLIMFENFVRTLPDWGFVLMGRTDARGAEWCQRMLGYKNFVYIPWATRDQVAAAWKLLDVTLLLYRPVRAQDGAFPVKVLESLYFGVPCVGTSTLKTRDLRGMVPLSPFSDHLKQLAVQIGSQPPTELKNWLLTLRAKMEPSQYLANVARWLQQ